MRPHVRCGAWRVRSSQTAKALITCEMPRLWHHKRFPDFLRLFYVKFMTSSPVLWPALLWRNDFFITFGKINHVLANALWRKKQRTHCSVERRNRTLNSLLKDSAEHLQQQFCDDPGKFRIFRILYVGVAFLPSTASALTPARKWNEAKTWWFGGSQRYIEISGVMNKSWLWRNNILSAFQFPKRVSARENELIRG